MSKRSIRPSSDLPSFQLALQPSDYFVTAIINIRPSEIHRGPIDVTDCVVGRSRYVDTAANAMYVMVYIQVSAENARGQVESAAGG